MQTTVPPPTQKSASKAALADASLDALISKASAVSFDFFDTLFVRPLAKPEDAFELIGRQFGVADFPTIRRAAQTEAFRRMVAAGRKEITLKGIYDCMPQTGVSTADLMQAEYALELSLVRPNPEVFLLFLDLLKAGKPVVIASDMYMPGDFFKDVLKPHGLDHVPVFTSADQNATKRDTGELFECIASQLGLEIHTILHIGDSHLADVVRPQEKGMMAYHYVNGRTVRVAQSASLMASIAQGMLSAFAHEITPNAYAGLGFAFGGPANVGFLEWIKERSRQDGVDHVLFLSRDGYAMQRIVAERGDKEMPDSCYFLGSRTAYTLAAMHAGNFEDYIPFLLSGAGGLSPHELLDRIGVQAPSQKVMQDLELGEDVKIEPTHHAQLGRFLIAYKQEILKVCQRNRRGLFQYLREVGVQTGNRVAIVDVGWNGTTQEAFGAAVRPMMDLDVVGYYFCLANTPERLQRQEKQKMTAFINETNASAETLEAIFANRVAVEQFFSAPHASIIGFDIAPKGIQPIMDAGRGDTVALKAIAEDVCEGIEAFARHFQAFQQSMGFQAKPVEIAWPLIELLTQHTDSEAYRLIGRVKNFDAWGSSRNHVLTLAHYLPS